MSLEQLIFLALFLVLPLLQFLTDYLKRRAPVPATLPPRQPPRQDRKPPAIASEAVLNPARPVSPTQPAKQKVSVRPRSSALRKAIVTMAILGPCRANE